ncbi:MAG: NAD(P)/FAD-dependent oxidoreductase [Chloroflexi bacterium]|nr:NAD(P)/FAD-dependent oxidoreductase [Chloroflexota bacterium]
MNATYDVVIIGAGAVGSLIARELARYQLSILLIDKNSDVGEGTTKANTAIVHAGYDAKPGSAKARLNVAGNRMFEILCGELDIEFDRCGTLVAAMDADDLRTLEALRERGIANGVPGLEILDAAATLAHAPALNPAVRGALWAPTGGLVDPFQMALGAAENAVMNGVELALETLVTGFERQCKRLQGVVTDRGTFYTRWVIIAAGLWADDLMRKAGLTGFNIRPRKGEYYVLDRRTAEVMRSVLFPCPTPVSKGIMVTRTIHDNVLLGPNAVHVDDKNDLDVTAEGVDEVWQGALKLVPGLDRRDVIRSFAGLRASGSTDDFVISIPDEPQGLVVLAGIESPGLTAAPAIALQVCEMLREAGLRLDEKPGFNPLRRAVPRLAQLSLAERRVLIEQDPRYGHIVCRCEGVSEGQVAAACHGPIPARTYDGLKRRTRLGSGRCQGAFDLPLVIDIMARELGISPLEFTAKGGASRYLVNPEEAGG